MVQIDCILSNLSSVNLVDHTLILLFHLFRRDDILLKDSPFTVVSLVFLTILVVGRV